MTPGWPMTTGLVMSEPASFRALLGPLLTRCAGCGDVLRPCLCEADRLIDGPTGPLRQAVARRHAHLLSILAGVGLETGMRSADLPLGRSPGMFPGAPPSDVRREFFRKHYGQVECSCVHLGCTHRWLGGRLVCTLCNCLDFHAATDGRFPARIPLEGE